MIQPVSIADKISFSQNSGKRKVFDNEKMSVKMTPYVDSFKKQAKETKPILLTIAAGWTIYDIFSKTRSVPKALVCNFIGFFAPTLVISSALLSIVENKKTSKSSR